MIPKNKNINLMVDMSNIFYRCAFALQKDLMLTGYKDWGIFKHTVIGLILDFKKKFRNNPVKVLLCYDDKKTTGKYWRHDIFPEYKENRKKAQYSIPKDILFPEFAKLEEELKSNLPWHTLKVVAAEADDIIGAVTLANPDDVNIILSPDKDFQQLQSNPNVHQWCPHKKTYLVCDNPAKFTFDHLMRGDSSDNIPNIFSDADTITHPAKKQKILRQIKVNEMWVLYKSSGMKAVANTYFNEKEKDRFKQNRQLIDLKLMPAEINKTIMKQFKNSKIVGNEKLFFNYCVENRLQHHLENSMSLI